MRPRHGVATDLSLWGTELGWAEMVPVLESGRH
jgi:hypothetical protein